MAVSESDQLQFLTNIQKILSDGVFTSTYKYALLLAFADICIAKDQCPQPEGSLVIELDEIAEKFIEYYWRQSRPFLQGTSPLENRLLRQNMDPEKHPVIIRFLSELNRREATLSASKAERRLKGEVRRTVRKMPIVYLQNIGAGRLEFLYDSAKVGESLILKPGVMFCFRKFYPLVTDLIRGGWLQYIRRRNSHLLGSANELSDFLFGSDRRSLKQAAEVLRKVTGNSCFYCTNPISRDAQVDHFIAWRRYPMDLGHNFVLAHAGCNSDKSDMLAAECHVGRWVERNQKYGEDLEAEFTRNGIVCEAKASRRIASWAYEQGGDGMAWVKKRTHEALTGEWRRWLDCDGPTLAQ